MFAEGSFLFEAGWFSRFVFFVILGLIAISNFFVRVSASKDPKRKMEKQRQKQRQMVLNHQ